MDTFVTRRTQRRRGVEAAPSIASPPLVPSPSLGIDSSLSLTANIDSQASTVPATSSELEDVDEDSGSEFNGATNELPPSRLEEAEVVIQGVTYRKMEEVFDSTNRRKRKKYSKIWLNGEKLIDPHTSLTYFFCHRCSEKRPSAHRHRIDLFNISKGISSVKRHLLNDHGIGADGRKKQLDPRRSVIQQQRQSSTATMTNLVWRADVEQFKLYFLRWIVYCHIAFLQVENQYFRDLMFYCNAQISVFLPATRKTVRGWVMAAYDERKLALRDELQGARSKISLSFDLWTSASYLALMAINAHWIDKMGTRRTTLLALRQVIGEHSGENQADVVVQVIEEYDIQKKLGHFVLDNASNNDSAVDLILKRLYPDMTAVQRKQRRLRCLGHVVNLAAQYFLLGKNAEDHLSAFGDAYRKEDFDTVATLWKQHGPLGRLYNIVKYIRGSPQRREEYSSLDIAEELDELAGLQLIQSNATRWNSSFYSIARALDVQERVRAFCRRHRVDNKPVKAITENALTDEHWELLTDIQGTLEHFYEVTTTSEGNDNDISKYFLHMDYLLDETDCEYTKYKAYSQESQQSDYSYLAACSHAAWELLEKYYLLMDESPVYLAALVLNPSYKWQWFETEWKHHEVKYVWFEKAQASVRTIWEEYKASLPPTTVLSTTTGVDPFTHASTTSRYANLYEHHRITEEAVAVDQYEVYCNTPRERHSNTKQDFDSLTYWNSRYETQPEIACWALDLLAIPCMSAQCERTFSSAGLLITNRRNKLNSDVIEANECLKDWFGKPEKECFDAQKYEWPSNRIG